MGWASGSSLFAAIWGTVSPHIPVAAHAKAAEQLFRLFRDRDCDTLHHVLLDYPQLRKALEASEKPAATGPGYPG